MGRAVPASASFHPELPKPTTALLEPGKGCATLAGVGRQAPSTPMPGRMGAVGRVGALLPLCPQGVWVGLLKEKPTHDLSLRSTKIQVEHLGAVIGGHLQLLEGLLEQDGPAEPGFAGGDGEALVDVDGQGAVLSLPRAGWGWGRDRGEPGVPLHPPALPGPR